MPSQVRSKPCPQCGHQLVVERHILGSLSTRSKTYYKCEQSYCSHKELETSSKFSGIEETKINCLSFTDTENEDFRNIIW